MMQVILDIKVCTPNHASRAWRAEAAARKRMHRAVDWQLHYKQPPPLPVTVTMIRYAPRQLDDDNLAYAFKAIRDQVAKWLGADDRPGSGIEWRYEQRKAHPREYYAELQIEGGAK